MKPIWSRRRLLIGGLLIMTLALTYNRTLQEWEYWGGGWLLRAMLPSPSRAAVTVITVPGENDLAFRQRLNGLLSQLRRWDVRTAGVMGPLSGSVLGPRLQQSIEQAARTAGKNAAWTALLEDLQVDARLLEQLQNMPSLVIGLPAEPVGSAHARAVVPALRVPTQVLFPSYLLPVFQLPQREFSAPSLAPMHAAARMGLWRTDSGVTVHLLHAQGENRYASFALQLASAAVNSQLRHFEGQGLAFDGQIASVSFDHRLAIWPAHVAVIAADEHLQEHAEQLRNAIVLIAPERDRRAAVLQAQAASGLLQSHYTHIPYAFYALQRLSLIVLAVLLIGLPGKRVPWMIHVGLWIALITTVDYFAFVYQNMWLPWTLPVGFLLLTASLLYVQKAAYRNWLDLYNDVVSARQKLAVAAIEQTDMDGAWQQLKKYVADPRLVETAKKIAGWYEQKADPFKAAHVYQYLIRHHGRDEEIQLGWRRTRHALLPQTTRAEADATQVLAPLQPVAAPAPVSLGRYRIEHELGKGAFGRVFLGVDTKIGRKVAVKTLDVANDLSESLFHETIDRFFREAEAAGKLNHPNIVTIYDVGEQDNIAYIAMDYIEGESLEHFLDPGHRLPLKPLLRIAEQVAEGLDYAHTQKIVHRDIKPANLIYNAQTQQVKITDFGVACMTDHRKTHSGVILGSPSYMSPEQVMGQEVDGRSDLFSLTVTVFHLLTGELPFDGESIAVLMYNIAHARPRSVRTLAPDLPAALVRVLIKGMQKNPDKRYKSGQAMADAFARCLELL